MKADFSDFDVLMLMLSEEGNCLSSLKACCGLHLSLIRRRYENATIISNSSIYR